MHVWKCLQRYYSHYKWQSIKRQVIAIQEGMVIYAPHHGEVWMTVWEIAELFNVTGTAVKNTIKRIWKQSVLKDFRHSQYIKLENGYSAHVYEMEEIIDIALQMETYQALLFRQWCISKVVNSTDCQAEQVKHESPRIIVMNGPIASGAGSSVKAFSFILQR